MDTKSGTIVQWISSDGRVAEWQVVLHKRNQTYFGCFAGTKEIAIEYYNRYKHRDHFFLENNISSYGYWQDGDGRIKIMGQVNCKGGRPLCTNPSMQNH